jgi:hypothetical protein
MLNFMKRSRVSWSIEKKWEYVCWITVTASTNLSTTVAFLNCYLCILIKWIDIVYFKFRLKDYIFGRNRHKIKLIFVLNKCQIHTKINLIWYGYVNLIKQCISLDHHLLNFKHRILVTVKIAIDGNKMLAITSNQYIVVCYLS